ncbi:MAG TPA: Na+/H+ antiporter subunit E [Gordonia sp. (in: high G+C Gram-positive bacteria)]|uniref:Na+/H+ antiporter subunit E n=1 Tax=unclassified Gordonia (in: high G+C Gram-positive bacteria) TaxID=2657482 RepID=UPI000F9A19B8|nr:MULTISPECIES: Na+/H+ antiporter subunit E [unclassified Gordonia (in: high G+C Gram-positive bacteria)]RUP41493.1 MAG: Na+/H+ antiporter subunit E [Gordonia sp. (in: high G+C Gram-positive bacteria)]HNP57151.1 Na+/H+ antiporter subunit E [Gordonia sp. (in: high G+C Gram-positive bacteria)]HRC50529.1 Na+/H+ antiporter subunit E [Gordonia sp. (in: high G+C Gram-positive bacteria)]
MRAALINAWRLTLLSIFWACGQAFVWLAGHVKVPDWLGGDLREVGVRLWTVSWLTFVWVLLWGRVSWANILAGFVMAIAIITLLPLPRVPVEGRLHPVSITLLVLRLIRDFFLSSMQVAWAAVRPHRPPLGAVVRRRVAIKSDMVLTLAINYINLVPGTLVVEIDHRRRMLYIHVFDLSTPRKVAAFDRQIAFVERAFIHAFERDSEWHPSPYHGIDDEYHNRVLAQREADGRELR